MPTTGQIINNLTDKVLPIGNKGIPEHWDKRGGDKEYSREISGIITYKILKSHLINLKKFYV
ncbi:hypothetical protein MNBD_BACTEROID01-1177 [hydrothermal vent metagenome]|uniref:Uncharacterized protein n=1 Tax=hydrothermal vent metagenome TaxID=652676 RepID=A0A3B0TRE8_9ZZZZ